MNRDDAPPPHPVPGTTMTLVRPGSAGSRGTLLMAAGAAGLAFAAVALGFAIRGRVGQVQLQLMTTLPILAGLAALFAGWTVRRAPARVEVGPDGLVIGAGESARRLGWGEVGSATVGPGALSQRRQLKITDPAGKTLARLDESFGDLDAIADAIGGYFRAKGDGTERRILQRRARRQGAFVTAAGLGLFAVAVSVAWTTHADARAARRLAAEGVPGVGEVVRRFVAPNSVTKRIEYHAPGAGSARNVEVDPATWEALADARTIPVTYVPGEPTISRLRSGEVADGDIASTPAGGYTLAALGGLLGLSLLAAGPWMWKGWDLALDPKTKKWSLKRYGEVAWSSRGPARPEGIEAILRSGSPRGT